MAEFSFGIGVHSFREIREEGCVYVDKTRLIERLVHPSPDKVCLFTRPRRFGKTLAMTMLREFFSIETQSGHLFDGLEIAGNEEITKNWMNQYPTILLSFKSVEGNDFTEAFGQFRELAIRLCSGYSFLLQSEKVDFADKRVLAKIMAGEEDTVIFSNLLGALSSALEAFYGKKVIILIDEYDVPLAKAEEKGFYSNMAMFFTSLLGSALNDNPSLKFAVLSGCLSISKESVYTGTNNISCYGISEIKFSDCFGFTESEVCCLLSSTGYQEKLGELRDWYDGYRFGDGQEIYCPWDVLRFLKSLQDKPQAKPRSFWRNTSGNDVIRRFLEHATTGALEGIASLARGESIETEIDESITYDELFLTQENMWTMLYLTGYLTKSIVNDSDFTSSESKVCLRIPNREINDIFNHTIRIWNHKKIKLAQNKTFFNAFWDGNEQIVGKVISELLMKIISFRADHENYYHGFLTGLLAASGYTVSSNSESGDGLPDIIVADLANKRVAIVEINYAKAIPLLSREVGNALTQIRKKRYDAPYRAKGVRLVHWGMAFSGKDCLAGFMEPGRKTPVR